MLIKNISLSNFRQFRDTQTIEFSSDKKSNITIVMGDNGSGKTTLAQAFLWVLYGTTDFKDKRIVNKKAIEEGIIGGKVKTEVNLYIEDEEVEYVITRRLDSIKRASKIEEKQAVLEVRHTVDGNMNFHRDDEAQRIINNILPKELSKFFFFDGERIKNMSDEIQKGKSAEFANAVRGLVGLNAMMNAIRHLKDSRGANTVIGRYNKKIDETGEQEVKVINSELDKKDIERENLIKEKKEIEPNIDFYHEKSIQLKDEIMQYSSAEEQKKKYDDLEKSIKEKNSEIKEGTKNYINTFNKDGMAFLLKPLIEITKEDLKEITKVDSGVPSINDKTVKYLLEKGECICGNKIEKDSDEWKRLQQLLDVIPPKSIGTLVSENKTKSKFYLDQSQTFFSHMETQLKNLQSLKKNIEDMENESANLYSLITNYDYLRNLKSQKEKYEQNYISGKNKISSIDKRLGEINSEVNNLNAKKEKYINIDKNNRKFILYRQYARDLYEVINNQYTKVEEEIRNRLEDKINEIFENIFDDGLSLTLDDNYNIRVNVKELRHYDSEVERSTAQNYSVIFAFIAGIIDIAKEKANDGNNEIFDNATNYPLVMDAPLSAFDKQRIGNICNTIPGIARQVIFFIKDTDGDVAESHMKDSIGKKYKIIKDDYLTSRIN